MKKPPRSIKIGAHTWRIKRMLTNPGEDAGYDPKNEFGMCDFGEHILWLNGRMIPSQRAETFFHEVTHAINDHCGVNDGATEEHFTTQSAKGWVQVAKDNPWVLPYLQSLLHPEPKPAPDATKPD